jgi:hypothetical protein
MKTDFTSGIEKKDGWSVSRELVSGDDSRVCSLQADFRQKPGIYTAQFLIATVDLVPPQPPGPQLLFYEPILAEAEIEWAVEGNTVKRRLSVLNGATISGPGQAVRIVVRDSTVLSSAPLPFTYVLGQKYIVAVTLTPGLRAADSPPVLWSDNGIQAGVVITINPGFDFVLPVPIDAGSKSVLVTVASAGTPIPEQAARVTQEDGLGIPMAAYDPRAFSFCPLVPGIAQLRLNNFGVTDLLFSVFWGIDG